MSKKGSSSGRELQTVGPGDVGTFPVSLLGNMLARQDEISDAFAVGTEGQARRSDLNAIPIIRIDHDGEQFLVAGQPTLAVTGYPIHWFQGRAWWKDGYEEGKANPPDCYSSDMVRPSPASEDVQAESCGACALAQFGSAAAGRGQACKVNTFLFLANPEFGNPPVACLLLPPSSIKAVLGGGRTPGYLQGAKLFKDPTSGRQARYYELVWTQFVLAKGGARHMIVAPSALSVCPNAEEARALAAMRGQFMNAMEALRGDVARVATGGGDDGN